VKRETDCRVSSSVLHETDVWMQLCLLYMLSHHLYRSVQNLQNDHRTQLGMLISLEWDMCSSVRFWWWCVTFGIILYGLCPLSHVTNKNTNRQTNKQTTTHTFRITLPIGSNWVVVICIFSPQNVAFYFWIFLITWDSGQSP